MVTKRKIVHRNYEYEQKEMINEWKAQLVVNSRYGTADEMVIGENIKGHQYWKFDVLTPQDRWLDGGAHIGTFTMIAAHFVKQVVAVEVDPDTYQTLRQNCEENRCSNVVALHGGFVGKKMDGVDLYRANNFAGFNTGNTTIPTRGRETIIHVPAWDINTLLEQYHFTKMKLDVEGREEEALYEIRDEFWPEITDIVFEWHPAILKDKAFYNDPKNSRFVKMMAYLYDKGFHTQWNPQMHKQRMFLAYVSREPKKFSWLLKTDVFRSA